YTRSGGSIGVAIDSLCYEKRRFSRSFPLELRRLHLLQPHRRRQTGGSVAQWLAAVRYSLGSTPLDEPGTIPADLSGSGEPVGQPGAVGDDRASAGGERLVYPARLAAVRSIAVG